MLDSYEKYIVKNHYSKYLNAVESNLCKQQNTYPQQVLLIKIKKYTLIELKQSILVYFLKSLCYMIFLDIKNNQSSRHLPCSEPIMFFP